MSDFQKLAKAYRDAALLVFNTLLFFALLNLAIWVCLRLIDLGSATPDPVTEKYGEIVLEAYPGWTKTEVTAMLGETWDRQHIFKPYVMFREKPRTGKFVNVDPAGFRHVKDQGPWPPDPGNRNVFLFGGSTTFGYGMPDRATIASFLQEALRHEAGPRIAVYNFGCGSYYSTQERVLLEKFVSDGIVPDIAVFFDGLNEFFHANDEPRYSVYLQPFMDTGMTHPGPGFLEALPVGELARRLKPRAKDDESTEQLKFRLWRDAYKGVPVDERGRARLTKEEAAVFGDEKVLSTVLTRYMRNKEMVEALATHYGFQTVFAWQPVPTHNYDQRHHLFAGPDSMKSYTVYGYPMLEKVWKAGELGEGFLWCADMQKDKREPLYVDAYHYTEAFSKEIAEGVARFMLVRGDVRAKPPHETE